MARTAVVAGTATAVSGAMIGKQQQKQVAAANAQAEEVAEAQQMADMQQQLADLQAQQVAAAVPAAAPAAAASSPLMQQLEQLSAMKAQGILTDEEFTAAKAKLLAG